VAKLSSFFRDEYNRRDMHPRKLYLWFRYKVQQSRKPWERSLRIHSISFQPTSSTTECSDKSHAACSVAGVNSMLDRTGMSSRGARIFSTLNPWTEYRTVPPPASACNVLSLPSNAPGTRSLEVMRLNSALNRVQWERPELCLPVSTSILCSYPGSKFHDGSPCFARSRSRNHAFFSRS